MINKLIPSLFNRFLATDLKVCYILYFRRINRGLSPDEASLDKYIVSTLAPKFHG